MSITKGAIDALFERKLFRRETVVVNAEGIEANLYVDSACIAILQADDRFIIGSGTGSEQTFDLLKELLALAGCELYIRDRIWRAKYAGRDISFNEAASFRFQVEKYITLEVIKEYYKIPKIFKVKK